MKQTLERIRNHRVVQGMHFYSLGLMKRLYLWVLSWADSKYSTLALCILAFTESSFFPIPPDTLQLALSISKPKRSYWYAFLASIFSVLGGILGYFIGVFLFESVGNYSGFRLPGTVSAGGTALPKPCFLGYNGSCFYSHPL